MKLSLLATLWTGIIVGAIPLIIYIDQIANARYNVLLIEGFAVLFNIGIFLVVFPSFGVLCSLFLYILWKSIEILIKKIAIELK